MNYTIHQLRVFCKIVELGSITRASEELYMTQPAVSIQLKKFQEQFDIPLYNVVGRNVQISEFGFRIAEIANKALMELDEIKYHTEQFQGLLTGKLIISSASTGKYVIPYFLTDFLRENPGVDLTLDVTNKSKVIQSLLKGEIDFALVSTIPDHLDLSEEVLIDNKLYLINNLPTKDDDKPLIFREEGSATRLAMEKYFNVDNTFMRKRMELTSNEAVKQAIIAGLGMSIMPLIGIHNEIENGEAYIIESENLPMVSQWKIVWLKNRRLTPPSEAWLNHVRTHKEQIIKKYFAWYDHIG